MLHVWSGLLANSAVGALYPCVTMSLLDHRAVSGNLSAHQRPMASCWPVQVSDKYVALARAVLDGEKALLAAWTESVVAAVPVLLQEPVLRRGAAEDGQQAHILVNYSPALLEARSSVHDANIVSNGAAPALLTSCRIRHRPPASLHCVTICMR